MDGDAQQPLLVNAHVASPQKKGCCRRHWPKWLALTVVSLLAGLVVGAYFYLHLTEKEAGHDAKEDIFRASPPGQPDHVRLSRNGPTSQVICWNVTSGGSQVLTTEVRVQCSTHTWTTAMDMAEVPCAIVSGLNASTPYVYSVAAINSVGRSPSSSEMKCSTTSASPPGRPARLAVVNSSATTLTVAWDRATDGGGCIDEYTVNVTAAGYFHSWSYRDNKTAVLDGLPSNTSLSVSVAAHNEAGGGSVWELQCCTDATNAGKPPPITAPTMANASSTYVVLSWRGETVVHGAMVLAYEIEARHENSTQWHWADELSGGCRACVATVGALAPLQGYQFRARQRTSQGWSSWSAPSDVVMTLAPRTPSAPTRSPRPLAASPTSLTVLPLPEGCPPSDLPVLHFNYLMDDWLTGAPLRLVGNFSAKQPNTTITLADLVPSQVYHIAVQAVSEAGAGEISDALSFFTNWNGNCGNPSDLAIFKHKRYTLREMLDVCIDKALLDSLLAMEECLQETVGLSKGCARCWVDQGRCASTRCFNTCAPHPTSKACFECSKAKCFDVYYECSGLPLRVYPPYE